MDLAQEGRALYAAGRFAEAAEVLQRAAEARPADARLLHDAGAARQMLGDYRAAEDLFRRALAISPEAPRLQASLGLVRLAQGDFVEGFRLYEAWRRIDGWRASAAPDLPLPRWAGEPLAGKRVLVWSEEGLGDQIMFARFAAGLQARGAQVVWGCAPAMARLLGEGLGVEVAPSGQGVSGVDVYMPSSGLPVVFLSQLGEPIPPAPYLTAPAPNRIEGLTIGVVARGNPDHWNDANRSLTPEAEARLMALPGAVSLAPAQTGARDFWDTAAIVAGLDLVISVDTSVAHLAGALGKPVWLLLPRIGVDWRWGSTGEASVWYASMRLFRQRTAGDWSEVLDRVEAALSGAA
jgi:hypothetical protein